MSSEMMMLYVIAVIAYVSATLFWMWMFFECATKEEGEGLDKMIWVVFIMMSHVFGALIYFLHRRPKRIKQLGR